VLSLAGLMAGAGLPAACGELLVWPSTNRLSRSDRRAGTIKRTSRFKTTRSAARSGVRTLNCRGRNISMGTRLPCSGEVHANSGRGEMRYVSMAFLVASALMLPRAVADAEPVLSWTQACLVWS
jgi:hypothetical protein